MKKLDRIILTIFSLIIFIETILGIGLIIGFIRIEVLINLISTIMEKVENTRIIIAIIAVLFLFSIKGIFFVSTNKTKKTQGILMQNENGKLLIAKATIENIVLSVVKDFDSVSEISVKTDTDNYNNLIIFVNLSVNKDVIIKELTLNMQNKIKDAIKKTSDLDVKEVNINIKNITTEKKENNHEKKEIIHENEEKEG